jgi:DNA-binding CsgD family transcriptional regulator
MRVERDAMERYIEECRAAAPGDPMLEGLVWGARGMLELLAGGGVAALDPWERGMAILGRLPHAEPAALRAMWPAVLASLGDRRARAAIDEARRLGVAAFNLNRGLIEYAEAVLAGRAGERRRANEIVAAADSGFRNCGVWRDVVRVCVAPSASADGWGDPRRWLSVGAERVGRQGLDRFAELCRELLASSEPNPWAGAGVTAREADVLRLVIEGRTNKEIAAHLHLSARTVEKHVERLLQKTAARSRTELAVAASRLPRLPH